MKVDEYNTVCVISPEGDLAGREGALVRDAIDERLRQRQCVNFVIDLAATRFIDSIGLETLLDAQRRCEERGGQLKLAKLVDNARTIFRLTRLEHRFECHLDLQSALKTMGWYEHVRPNAGSRGGPSTFASDDTRPDQTRRETAEAGAQSDLVRAAA